MPLITPDTENELTLDDLFSLAKKHIREMKAEEDKKAKSPKRVELEAKKAASFTYAPETWIDEAVVALVAESTGEFLGKFLAQKHRSNPEAYRYVAAPTDSTIQRTVEVRGTWGRPASAPITPSHRSVVTRELSFPVAFVDIRGLPALVDLLVTTNVDCQALVAVKLAKPYLFPDGNQIFALPAATDILPSLRLECKADLRRSIFHGN